MHRHPTPSDDATPLRRQLLEVPAGSTRGAWAARLAALAALTLYSLGVCFGRMTEPASLLHLSVILFHEAGHVLFAAFGDTLRVAGGTFAQLLMPLVCAIAFVRRGDNFGAAVCALWTSLSLIDASIYAYDAADPLLPLIGGGTGADSFHDFIFLFDRYGQLGHARGWAMAMKALGVLGVAASAAWAATLLYLENEELAGR